MTVPKKDESKDDFINRCIPYVINEGETKDSDQAAAICNSIWKREKKEENKKMKKDRKLFHLDASLKGHINLANKNNVEFERCTILVSDGTYNGVYFPREEVDKFYQFFDGKPINLNHSDSRVEDIVGYLTDLKNEDGKITAKPVIDENTSKYEEAMGFIKTRFAAGDIPNVSIGIWIDLEEEELENEKSRIVAKNGEPDHLALVVHGACSPSDGCGVGLSNNSFTVSNDDKYIWLTEDMFMEKKLDQDGNPKLYWQVTNTDAFNDEEKKLRKKILKEQIKMEEKHL